MTIQEKDKLIAEFDGYYLCGDTYYRKRDSATLKNWFKEAKYHTSWDWIIPVIRKAKASEHSSNWPGWELLNIELLKCHKPEDLIHDVIEFIQWYNQNKPA